MPDEYIREITITATCPDGTSESVHAEVKVEKADPLRAAEVVREAAINGLGDKKMWRANTDR